MKHILKISQLSDDSYYCYMVREQSNGFGGVEEVVTTKGKYYKTIAAAKKMAIAYNAKREAA